VTARLGLTLEAEDLVDAFAAALTDAGATAWASTIGGARAFCARYRTPARFSGSSLDRVDFG
jgi:hypothetical protein